MAKRAVALFLVASALAPCALAAMAPKFERLNDLGVALDHIREVADLLDAPIDRIEYVSPNVIFTAGRCRVAMKITYSSGLGANGMPVLGGSRPTAAIVGPAACRP